MSILSLSGRGSRRRRGRLMVVAAVLALVALAAALALTAFRESVVFFHGPTDVVEGRVPDGRLFRLGGLVAEGSVASTDGGVTTLFTITDLAAEVPVTYTGVLPDLFREGQGVVAMGRMGDDGLFTATEVLAKHDENYMPPEAVEAMKRAGTWQHEEGAAGRP